MRTSPALVAIDTAPETAPPRVDEVIRTLVGLIEKVSAEMAQGPYACNAAAEEVLVDTEVEEPVIFWFACRGQAATGFS